MLKAGVQFMDVNQLEIDISYVFELLKCQFNDCPNYLVPPIKQCNSGHSFCSLCDWENSCPICFSPFLKNTCVPLEKIVKSLLVPCKFKGSGCAELFPPTLLLEHEQSCVYNFLKCISDNCQWNGNRDDLWSHMVKNHKNETITVPSTKINVPLNNQSNHTEKKLIKFDNTVFIVHILSQPADHKIYGCVQYLHAVYKTGNKYKYEFQLKLAFNKGEKTFSYAREVHSLQYRAVKIFQTQDCFIVGTEFAQDFAPNCTSVNLMLLIFKDRNP